MTTTNQERSQAKFALGEVFTTPSVGEALAREDVVQALHRHVRGDWGDVGEAMGKANDGALAHSSRLFSSYRAQNGTRFWVITEDDHAFTVVFLPEDYNFTPVPTSIVGFELMRTAKQAVKS